MRDRLTCCVPLERAPFCCYPLMRVCAVRVHGMNDDVAGVDWYCCRLFCRTWQWNLPRDFTTGFASARLSQASCTSVAPVVLDGLRAVLGCQLGNFRTACGEKGVWFGHVVSSLFLADAEDRTLNMCPAPCERVSTPTHRCSKRGDILMGYVSPWVQRGFVETLTPQQILSASTHGQILKTGEHVYLFKIIVPDGGIVDV